MFFHFFFSIFWSRRRPVDPLAVALFQQCTNEKSLQTKSAQHMLPAPSLCEWMWRNSLQSHKLLRFVFFFIALNKCYECVTTDSIVFLWLFLYCCFISYLFAFIVVSTRIFTIICFSNNAQQYFEFESQFILKIKRDKKLDIFLMSHCHFETQMAKIMNFPFDFVLF